MNRRKVYLELLKTVLLAAAIPASGAVLILVARLVASSSMLAVRCISGSICFELIKGIPVAFVALIIGLIAAGIAWRQFRVAKTKLRLDMFDKRYPIYLETWKILSEVAREGTRVRSYGLGNPFSNFIPQARFLYGKDVETYLSHAVEMWTELWGIEGETADLQGPARLNNIERRRELRNWFFEQASSGAKELFGRYLDFENWE
jgi:hypothetical protein